MPKYLLATYGRSDQSSGPPSNPEEMAAFMQGIVAVEEEMDRAGAFVFGGALHGADAATVIDHESDPLITDGPYVESKEHIAGFYIIEADDLDAALRWGEKVSVAIRNMIEVRPFSATGRVQM